MHWLIKLLQQKSKAQNRALGELLRKARTAAGMTQTRAAAAIGKDQTFIARLEAGKQQATFVEVEQLAQSYGKQLTDFKTIDQVELRFRNFAIKPAAVDEYASSLLQKRKRRRKPQRRRSTKRQRKSEEE
jgi:transcriptional regulator with XRE-family HTH domain